MTKRLTTTGKLAALCGLLLVGFVAAAHSAGVNMNDLPDGLYAEMATTKGTMVIALEFEKTPLTVINFVGLAEGKLKTSSRQGQKFFDGLIFHRIIKDFMIQGGDPAGVGTGGPGYKFADEIDPSLTFTGPGLLAMANSGPGTNGSQFFITLKDTSWLNGKHTIFGHVVVGMDVLNTLGTVKTAPGDKPIESTAITSVTIIRKGAKAQAFKADQAAFDVAVKSADDKKNAGGNAKRAADEAAAAKLIPNGQKTADGILYEITKAGSGPKPKPGQTISAHYTGKFLDGRIFDSSVNRGPFDAKIGVGQVIGAWDEMVMQMQVGEKVRLVAPPELAYGERGHPAGIPPNSYLYFELELLAIK